MHRPSLTDPGVSRPAKALPQALPRASSAKARTPARVGKKALALWTSPEASQQLRMASVTMDRTLQSILAEAVDDWFQKHGMHRLAAAGAEEKDAA